MKKSLLATLPVAAFVAGVAVVPSVFADSSSSITTWNELKTCLEGGEETCKLGTFEEKTGETIDINGTKTLDLNGQTVITDTAGALFDLKDNDQLTITNGTMKATKAGAGVMIYGAENAGAADGSTKLVIKNDAVIQDLNLAFWYTGGHNNYGAELDVYGRLINTGIGNNVVYINGEVTNTTNAPVINIHDGAVVDGGPKVIPFYLAGYGTTTINQATVRGVSGVAIKAGVLNLNGATIEAYGGYSAGEPFDNGVYATGAAVQIEANGKYAGGIDVNINGGTSLTSTQGNAIQAYGDAQNKVDEIALEGENIVLKSAPGLPVLGVSSQIAETFPEATFDGKPIDLDPIALYATIAAVALIGLGVTVVIAKKARR